MGFSRFFFIFLVSFFGPGCSSFNFPFTTTQYVVVTTTGTPRVMIYEFGRRGLTQIATFSTGPTGSFGIATPNRLIYGSSTVATLNYSPNSGSSGFSVNASALAIQGLGASNDGNVLYYSTNVDEIATRSISSNGTIGGADLQVTSGSGITGYYERMLVSSSGTYMVALPTIGAGDLAPVVFERQASTGILTGSVAAGPSLDYDPILAVPGLGSHYYWSSYVTAADLYSVDPATFSTTVVATSPAGDFTVSAAHPTQPWIFAAPGTVLNRYTLTTSSISLASSISFSSGPLSIGMAVTSNGKYLVVATTTKIFVYSISSSGALTLWSETSLGGTFSGRLDLVSVQ